MSLINIRTVVETDGELHLSNLPCYKGDVVEAVLSLPNHISEQQRKEALERFLERARTSSFRSVGPYPTREELHERS